MNSKQHQYANLHVTNATFLAQNLETTVLTYNL